MWKLCKFVVLCGSKLNILWHLDKKFEVSGYGKLWSTLFTIFRHYVDNRINWKKMQIVLFTIKWTGDFYIAEVLFLFQINCMVVMQQAPQKEVEATADQAVTLATAPFTPRAALPTPPLLFPAPTPAPLRERATSQCLLPPIRRAPTATGMEMRRRRC